MVRETRIFPRLEKKFLEKRFFVFLFPLPY